MRKIYLASSWHNLAQPNLVRRLRAAGHQVYDFRDRVDGTGGLDWASFDADRRLWDIDEYARVLQTNPIARRGFERDRDALLWADTCVLQMPCGLSAHLELGYACGLGRHSIIMLHGTNFKPELMHLFCDQFVTSADELIAALRSGSPPPKGEKQNV